MECIIETKWGSSDLLDKTFTKIVLLGISGGRKIQKKKEKRKETFKNMTDKCYQSTYRIFKVDVSWVV